MPVFSLAHSTIGFLRALLTMESDLLEDALARVEETRRCVDTFFKQVRAFVACASRPSAPWSRCVC